MDDLISRKAAVDALEREKTYCTAFREGYTQTNVFEKYNAGLSDGIKALKNLPSAQQWIPVKTRPMTEEERWNFEEHTGIQLEDEDAVFFDCKMPEDGQRIWISTIHGNVFEDFCENDGDFLGLEGNGDWLDVTAWTPMLVREPWKGEDDERLDQ